MDDIVKKISDLVKQECVKDSNPYGFFGSWKHMNHVVRLAKDFAKDTGADEEIVVLAAWLHDWGAIQGFYKEHHTKGAIEAKDILYHLNYPIVKIDQITYCIYVHRSSQGIKPKTIEAECVANADAVAHFLEIPDLLCYKYANGDMTVDKVVVWLKQKLERDLGKITFDKAKEMVAPYQEATEIILRNQSII